MPALSLSIGRIAAACGRSPPFAAPRALAGACGSRRLLATRQPLGDVRFAGFADIAPTGAAPLVEHPSFAERPGLPFESPQLADIICELSGDLEISDGGLALPPPSIFEECTDNDDRKPDSRVFYSDGTRVPIVHLDDRDLSETELNRIACRAMRIALGSSRVPTAPAGLYAAPRDGGTFLVRDLWSAIEDYERRLVAAGLEDEHHVMLDDVHLDERTGIVVAMWGS
jgi:hypothetical protein